MDCLMVEVLTYENRELKCYLIRLIIIYEINYVVNGPFTPTQFFIMN